MAVSSSIFCESVSSPFPLGSLEMEMPFDPMGQNPGMAELLSLGLQKGGTVSSTEASWLWPTDCWWQSHPEASTGRSSAYLKNTRLGSILNLEGLDRLESNRRLGCKG